MAERTSSVQRYQSLRPTAGSSPRLCLNGHCYLKFFLVGGPALNSLGHALAHWTIARKNICQMLKFKKSSWLLVIARMESVVAGQPPIIIAICIRTCTRHAIPDIETRPVTRECDVCYIMYTLAVIQLCPDPPSRGRAVLPRCPTRPLQAQRQMRDPRRSAINTGTPDRETWR